MKTKVCKSTHPEAGRSNACSAKEADEFAAWLAKYEPVEREIIEAHERRIENKGCRMRAQAKAFGDLCEATEGFAVVWRREGWSVYSMLRWAGGDGWTLLTLARWLRLTATKYIDRAQSRLRRPLYYAREKERRQKLAAERRRVGGRRTTSPCPTREDILEAWIHRQDSHDAAVRFGSMIHDLECYVDNSLIRDGDGAITGRHGGVKEWLWTNIPALYIRYTTVMRYKAMAKKLRQVTGIADPVPAAAVLAGRTECDYGSNEFSCNNDICGDGSRDASEKCEPEDASALSKRGMGGDEECEHDSVNALNKRDLGGDEECELEVANALDKCGRGGDEECESLCGGESNGRCRDASSDCRCVRISNGNADEEGDGRRIAPGRNQCGGVDGEEVDGTVPDLEVVRARAVWLEVTEGVRRSATALMERLDALTDPNHVEDANMLARWREKYQNEITERMKSHWWASMAKKGGA